MVRCGVAICVTVVLAGWGAWGQDAPTEPAPEGPATAAEAKDEALSGDILHLKSGKKLSGVQILRETPSRIVVEYLPGFEPLVIPRSQVESLEYDDIDPRKVRRDREVEGTESKPDVITGEEVSKELHGKLTEAMSEEPLRLEQQTWLEALTKLSGRTGVPLQVEDAVKPILKPQQRRDFEIPPGTSFMVFLQRDFRKTFAKAQVTYKYDKVIVSLREEEAPSGETQPPGEEAPSGEPAPGNQGE